MSAKAGALGFSSPDLMYMRLLMGQQQIPQMSIGPVNDLGSGVTAAGQQILNALITRRNMAQQNQIIQAMMAQAQAQQEAAQAAEQQRIENTVSALEAAGVPHHMALVGAYNPEASVQTNLLTYGQKQIGNQNLAKQIYQSGIYQVRDQKGNPVIGQDGQPQYAALYTPEEAMRVADSPEGPLRDKMALSMMVTGGLTSRNIDPNTPAGINAMKAYGLDPANDFTVSETVNRAKGLVLDNMKKLSELPYAGPQAAANLNKTEADTQNTLANTNRTNVETGYIPQLREAEIAGKKLSNIGQGIANDRASFGFDNEKAARQLVQDSVQSGTIANPLNNINNAALYGSLTGSGNPFQSSNEMMQKMVNPKAGNSPLEGMTTIGQQIQSILTPPQVAQPQMQAPQNLSPQVQGQLLQLDYQNALKAPGRMWNSMQLDINNKADYLKGVYQGFSGQ